MIALPRPRLPLFPLFKLKQVRLYAALPVFALLLFLVGIPLQAHADSSLPNTDSSLPNTVLPYSLPGKPTVNAALINRVLLAYHSPAAGTGQALYDYGVKYGVDPVFALAFFLHESTFGNAGVARVTHSLGNIRCTHGYSACYQGYRMYTSWEASFIDWYDLIRNVYVPSGMTTVEQIVPVYAPAIENDVQAYIVAVEHAVDVWRAVARNTPGSWSTQEITVPQSTAAQSTTQRNTPQQRPVQKNTVRQVTVPLQIIPEPGQSQNDGNGQPVQLP